MIEVNDGKIAVVHEIGLITSISRLHQPQTGQMLFNIVIISNGGTSMFACTEELFKEWILGITKAFDELNSKIVVPNLKLTNSSRTN